MTAIEGVRRNPPDPATRLDLGRHAGDRVLDRLELGDRLAELLARLRVGDVELDQPRRCTERVGRDTVFLPFHFAGRWGGMDMLPYYPQGAAPVIRGESVNTATTYGYDSVTMMQETKTTVCQIERAA